MRDFPCYEKENHYNCYFCGNFNFGILASLFLHDVAFESDGNFGCRSFELSGRVLCGRRSEQIETAKKNRKHNSSKHVSLCFFVFATFFLTSCLAPTDHQSAEATARTFLINDENEEGGYGLYSYLLFGEHPDASGEKRDIIAIGAYLNMIDPVKSVTAYFPKSKINITYIPLTEAPTNKMPTAEWVFAHYNFVRARILLRKVGTDLNEGPYIVSLEQPLSTTQTPVGRHLFQNLSHIPDDNVNIVGFWLREFQQQALQPEFWKPNTLKKWLLDFRTVISVLAAGIADATPSVEKWVKLVE